MQLFCMATNRNLEDPELQAIISKYGGPGALTEIQSQLVKSQPDFEAPRLARKSAVKFRY